MLWCQYFAWSMFTGRSVVQQLQCNIFHGRYLPGLLLYWRFWLDWSIFTSVVFLCWCFGVNILHGQFSLGGLRSVVQLQCDILHGQYLLSFFLCLMLLLSSLVKQIVPTFLPGQYLPGLLLCWSFWFQHFSWPIFTGAVFDDAILWSNIVGAFWCFH